jgi:2-amino-4-hydroxy-6-hydroxymethyldihydropteridine diphosphokinase
VTVERAYVALGSNLGDRRGHLDHALARLSHLGAVVDGSPLYDTDPVGGPEGQGAYLNAVIVLDTDVGPRGLLEGLLEIEQERGRERSVRWQERTLDCDLLLYGDRAITDDDLTVPHPEIRNRPFVLAPLSDVAPDLGDALGPFAGAMAAHDRSGIRRISGPVDPGELRWMTGLADAVRLDGLGPYHVEAHADWSNASGDAFGAFLAAVALSAGALEHPGLVPSDLAYRFVRPVPAGADITIEVTTMRESPSSAELRVALSTSSRVVGTCALTMIANRPQPVLEPPPPEVIGRHEAIPADRLVRATGRIPGRSLRSWTPLERWDLPDLADGTEPVLRAWSPNVTAGLAAPHLVAASMLMPIDALIWPATLMARGDLPPRSSISTPTIDLTVRYAEILDRPWYVAEAAIDHMAGRSAAGTVRVWGDDGAYGAIGHSLNLVLGDDRPTDGL